MNPCIVWSVLGIVGLTTGMLSSPADLGEPALEQPSGMEDSCATPPSAGASSSARVERIHIAYPWACDAAATVVDVPQIPGVVVRGIRGVICAWTVRGARINLPPFGAVEGLQESAPGPTYRSFEVTDPVELRRFAGTGMLSLTAWRPADDGQQFVCAGARVHLWVQVENP